MKLIPFAFLCLTAQAQTKDSYTVCVHVDGDESTVGVTAEFESTLSHALRQFGDVTILAFDECQFEIDVVLLQSDELVAGSVIFKTSLRPDMAMLADHAERIYVTSELPLHIKTTRSLADLMRVLEDQERRDPVVVNDHFVLFGHEANIRDQATRFASLFDSHVLEPARRVASQFE